MQLDESATVTMIIGKPLVDCKLLNSASRFAAKNSPIAHAKAQQRSLLVPLLLVRECVPWTAYVKASLGLLTSPQEPPILTQQRDRHVTRIKELEDEHFWREKAIGAGGIDGDGGERGMSKDYSMLIQCSVGARRSMRLE